MCWKYGEQLSEKALPRKLQKTQFDAGRGEKDSEARSTFRHQGRTVLPNHPDPRWQNWRPMEEVAAPCAQAPNRSMLHPSSSDQGWSSPASGSQSKSSKRSKSTKIFLVTARSNQISGLKKFLKNWSCTQVSRRGQTSRSNHRSRFSICHKSQREQLLFVPGLTEHGQKTEI